MKRMFILLLLALLCNPANAVMLSSLYSTEIVLQNNTDEARNGALEQALEQIILKVACNNKVLQHPEVAKAKQEINNYVISYSSHTEGEETILTAKFNEKMLQQLLTKAGYSFLTKSRPLTLVWLQSNLDQGPLRAKIESLSKNYGMPMIVPEINLPDVDLSVQQIKELSKRYKADLLLKAKVFENDGALDCQWVILDNLENNSWSSNGVDPDAEIAQMLNAYSDQLLQRFAKTPVSNKMLSQVYTLKITGINNVNTYNKVNEYLTSLAQVKNFEIKDVREDSAVFEIITDANKAALLKALAMGKILDGDNDSLDDSKSIAFKANL